MKLFAFGVSFDIASMEEAVDEVINLVLSRPATCEFVVTPNVDHILTLRRRDDFKEAYRHAALTYVDGWPVARVLSALTGYHVCTVPGSDLVPAILEACTAKRYKIRIFLLGAGAGVAKIAAKNITMRFPDVQIVGYYSPPFGFENDVDECNHICSLLRDSKPDLIVLGLGAPKQELWIDKHRDRFGGVAICAGATIDFIAGVKPRAPQWMRRMRLEWLHRTAAEPRRLAPRYIKGAIEFPILAVREFLCWRSRRRS